VTAESSSSGSRLGDSRFHEQLGQRVSSLLEEQMADLLSTGRALWIPVDLSEALGFSGQALQAELRHLLAVALLQRGWVDAETAAQVAGVPRAEVPELLETYGLRPSETRTPAGSCP
jgi:predicted HTH domain antitoxin